MTKFVTLGSKANLLMVIIILLDIAENAFTHAQENFDCSNYSGRRPYIWPGSTALATYAGSGDPRSTSIYKEQGEADNTFLAKQFNCSYSGGPIHWVFHLEPDYMNMEIDFSERYLDETGNNGSGRIIYSTNFELLYRLSQLRRPMLFSCEPTNLTNPCERNFVQIFNRNFVQEHTHTPVPALRNLSGELLKSRQETLEETFEDWDDCPLRLYLKCEGGNQLNFKWEVANNTNAKIKQKTIQTNETSYFDNLLRLHGSRESSCVKFLNASESCQQCRSVGEVKDTPINGVIFFASYGNLSLVLKGYFSVPRISHSDREYYFDWEMSPQIIEDIMVQLVLPEQNIYANISFEVKCKVSAFLFSYGSIISDKNYPEYTGNQPVEYFKPYGYREVVTKLTLFGKNETKTVSCFAPLKKAADWVTKSALVYINDAEVPRIDDSPVNATEVREVATGMHDIFIRCNASGAPIPKLSIIFPMKIAEILEKTVQVIRNEDENSIKVSFSEWKSDFFGTYVCQARNFLGVATKTVIFHPQKSDLSNITLPISSSLGVSAALLGAIVGILIWKIRRQRLEFEIQTRKAIEEFKNGVSADSSATEQDPNFSVHQLPYNQDFEVDNSKWEIQEKVLGSGQFGVVRMGIVNVRGEKVKVAVKTLKSSVEIDEFKSFLFELKIMAFLGHHKNIVSLVAACTEGIDDRNIFIGVEFCDNGCLLNYLRQYRATYHSMVTTDGKLLSDLSTLLELTSTDAYANIKSISTYDIYRWAYQIAGGMDYLRVRKVLHGDLAARNVLLNTRKVAKIGDFGLSRVLMSSEKYTKKSQTALPWKWMAIESLKERVFSMDSDVWAYGVCLYELVTVGQSPYPGIGWNPDFITKLENGFRMERPAFCTLSLYKVMLSCWERDPNQRPSYGKIKRKLSKGLQRLSIVLKEKNEYEKNPAKFQRKSSRTRSFTASLPPMAGIDMMEPDEPLMYTNIARGTMNYYKNS